MTDLQQNLVMAITTCFLVVMQALYVWWCERND